jgi:hypothetical protein
MRRMPLTRRRYLAVTAAAVLVTATAHAETLVAAPPHVRPETVDARALLVELASLSPTVRALIDQLQQSDVVVYIRHRILPTAALDGRTALLAVAAGRRYVVIELACVRPRVVEFQTLAHELRHAVEIASAPGVVDAPTLSAYYARIGIRIETGPRTEMFETLAAQITGRAVQAELRHPMSAANEANKSNESNESNGGLKK